MKGGVTKKEYLKLMKKMKKSKTWEAKETAKVLGYHNNRPWEEIYQMMLDDIEKGILPTVDFSRN